MRMDVHGEVFRRMLENVITQLVTRDSDDPLLGKRKQSAPVWKYSVYSVYSRSHICCSRLLYLMPDRSSKFCVDLWRTVQILERVTVLHASHT